jgi:hypothetical protein
MYVAYRFLKTHNLSNILQLQFDLVKKKTRNSFTCRFCDYDPYTLETLTAVNDLVQMAFPSIPHVIANKSSKIV